MTEGKQDSHAGVYAERASASSIEIISRSQVMPSSAPSCSTMSAAFAASASGAAGSASVTSIRTIDLHWSARPPDGEEALGAQGISSVCRPAADWYSEIESTVSCLVVGCASASPTLITLGSRRHQAACRERYASSLTIGDFRRRLRNSNCKPIPRDHTRDIAQGDRPGSTRSRAENPKTLERPHRHAKHLG